MIKSHIFQINGILIEVNSDTEDQGRKKINTILTKDFRKRLKWIGSSKIGVIIPRIEEEKQQELF